MTQSPLLRFAPSPNGRLHLGHAYSALFTWDMAGRLGGTALLRIEDIDPARCKPEFDAAIVEDLAWLGLTWPQPVLRQSQRMPVYAGALASLQARGLVYPCYCTRSEIARAAQGSDPDGAPLYPGTCRHLGDAARAGFSADGRPAQWRLDMAAATTLAGPLSFVETGQTRQAHPARWGDAVLSRKDTPTSYHLSVVVDDAAQGITHVTRGEDLLAATDLHVLLQVLLGLPTPLYFHHRLVLDPGNEKLAKSRGSASLKDLRNAGWSAADVRAHLGFA